MNNIKFCPLASGSSGNSVFISYGETKILIDAGIPYKRLLSNLDDINESMDNISAIFLTHEHSDHVQGLEVLSKHHNIPVYTTSRTWEQLTLRKMLKHTEQREIVEPLTTLQFQDFQINPIGISHDSTQPLAYIIHCNNKKIGFITDFGMVTKEIIQNLHGCHILYIESNYDYDMLVNGRYSSRLKRRILSQYGHISNVECAGILNEIDKSNLQTVYLAHLSIENNTPQLAFDTVSTNYKAKNGDLSFELLVSQRHLPSKICLI